MAIDGEFMSAICPDRGQGIRRTISVGMICGCQGVRSVAGQIDCVILAVRVGRRNSVLQGGDVAVANRKYGRSGGNGGKEEDCSDSA